MMQYLEEFKKAIESKKTKNRISCFYEEGNFGTAKEVKAMLGAKIPDSVIELFLAFNGLLISEPRHFELLKFSDIDILEEIFLHFAIMNGKEKICFNMSDLNSAGEWDIVNYKNGYVITKTLASFLTNKIWAWVDRARFIWEEESYA